MCNDTLIIPEEVIAQKEAENELLREQLVEALSQIAWLKQQLFGSKSEKIDPSQMTLTEEDEMGKSAPPLPEETSEQEEEKSKNEDESETSRKPRNKRRTKEELYDLSNLPIKSTERKIPAEVQANPEDYEEFGEPDVRNELEHVCGHVCVVRVEMPKFRRKQDRISKPLQEPAPLPSVPGTMLAPGFAAMLVVGKFGDHAPNHRQAQIFERDLGLDISRQTLNYWTRCISEHLSPIAQAVKKELLTMSVLQIDETPINYLLPGNGKTKKGYLWVLRDPITGLVYYYWHETGSRSADALKEALGYDALTGELEYRGIIQCDAYIAYETVKSKFKGIELGSCMAHIRRKFIEDDSLLTYSWGAELIKDIQKLYVIEEKLRKANATPEEKVKKRQEQSRLILEKIHTTLKTQENTLRPKEGVMGAIRYALNQWDGLLLYLTNGKLDLDNNGAENAVRPTKLGRKNWLFFGSLSAGQRNADLFTLVQNCKVHRINPREYLEYAIKELRNLPPEQLTPASYAELLKQNRRKAA